MNQRQDRPAARRCIRVLALTCMVAWGASWPAMALDDDPSEAPPAEEPLPLLQSSEGTGPIEGKTSSQKAPKEPLKGSGSYRDDAPFVALGHSGALLLEGGLTGNKEAETYIQHQLIRIFRRCEAQESSTRVRFVLSPKGSVGLFMATGASSDTKKQCLESEVRRLGEKLRFLPEFHTAEPTRVTFPER